MRKFSLHFRSEKAGIAAVGACVFNGHFVRLDDMLALCNERLLRAHTYQDARLMLLQRDGIS